MFATVCKVSVCVCVCVCVCVFVEGGGEDSRHFAASFLPSPPHLLILGAGSCHVVILSTGGG